MKLYKVKLSLIICALMSLCASELIVAEENTTALNLQQLLIQVKAQRTGDANINKKREGKFIQQKKQQTKLLQQAKSEFKKSEAQSQRLETLFSENEKTLTDKRQELNESMGSLKELFGHLTAAAGDFRSSIDTSIISAQYTNRTQALDQLIQKMESASLLPEVDEIDALWIEILREMTESSKVVSFNAAVINPNGETEQRDIIRIGSFNLVSGDKYLSYSSQNANISELARQPSSSFTNALTDLNSSGAFTAIGIDPSGPTGGSYLSALVDSPSLTERWHQGGIVGYIISLIGLLTTVLVVWRLVGLSQMHASIVRVLKAKTVKTTANNALTRVLMLHFKNPKLDAETLEAKLSESILQERPAIERHLSLLKIVAMVAPLLGLLGTVAGMIVTFQAITIYGAGDPKAMAGGISSALVTTVLGLMVAIPTVFAHSLLNSKAQSILNILEQQAMGLIARHSETQFMNDDWDQSSVKSEA